MIPAHDAIARLRRDLTLSSVLKGVLLGSAVLCLMLEMVLSRQSFSGAMALAIVGGVWLVLSYHSMKGSRITATSPTLIAAGQYEQAEQQIEEALRSFSLFRAVKLRSLHHLVLLRHAQRRWGEAAMLSQALLGQRLGTLAGLSRSTRLILASSLLEVGDVTGAYAALAGVYQERLTLGEALELTLVQLAYEAQIGAWPAMMQGVRRKAELAELMPAEKGARVHALLALAARRTGQTQWEAFLRRRAELTADPREMASRWPVLAEVWAGRSGAEALISASPGVAEPK